MLNDSRIDIYDFLHSVIDNTVTANVYDMDFPQELTKTDADNGFLVLHVGGLNDESAFSRSAYAWTRCYVEAFVPPISRGRLNRQKYKDFESKLNKCIRKAARQNANQSYYIVEESILSMEGTEVSNANNAYHTFAKSFIVYVLTNPNKEQTFNNDFNNDFDIEFNN